jgi:hypothetical protein
MRTSKRWLAFTFTGIALFACAQAEVGDPNRASTAPLESVIGGKGGGEEPGAQRGVVLAEVQSMIDRYRETKSEADAIAIEQRFAGTALAFDRATGSLVPRTEPSLDYAQMVEAMTMGASQSPKNLEASARVAVGNLVWHAAVHASTAQDERQLTLVTVARGLSDAMTCDGSCATDGGTIGDGGTVSDAAVVDASTPWDGGYSWPTDLDWCRICTSDRELTFEEKLFKRACKAGLKELSRFADEEQSSDFLYCPPSDCSIPRTGWRGKLKAKDLLDGELSGSITYGFKCGRGTMEVNAWCSDVGGADPDFGASVSWGIRF